jgi:hypothetical protein
MRTIHLKISDQVYDKFIWLISKFSKEEVEILDYSTDFSEVKDYLHKELSEIENGKASFLNQNEFEKRLDQIV